MKREIKFRAFDKVTEKTSLPISLDEILKKDWDKFDVDRLVYQQYTGLVDKNGVEIYEGDVVFWADGDSVNKSEVYFKDNGRLYPFYPEFSEDLIIQEPNIAQVEIVKTK